MSEKGEDIQAYSRLLKYMNKQYGAKTRDYFLAIITLIISISVMLILSANSTDHAIEIFIGYVLFILIFGIAFLDYAAGLGIFKSRGVLYSAILLLLVIIVSIVVTVFASDIFIVGGNINPDTLAFINLVGLLIISVIASFFMLTSTPTRQGREEMIKKLKQLRKEIENTPMSNIGVTEALDRARRWLINKQENGIWGTEEPLYETAEALRTFLEMGYDLSYSWSTIEKGSEVIRTLEQTYYLMIESIENIPLEPIHEILSPIIILGQIDPDYINPEKIDENSPASQIGFKNRLKQLLSEFEEDLQTESEWDFLNTLEKIDESRMEKGEMPVYFDFAKIYHVLGHNDKVQKLVDLFANTYSILINRTTSRFNITEEREISNYILGVMYNTLSTIIKPPIKYQMKEAKNFVEKKSKQTKKKKDNDAILNIEEMSEDIDLNFYDDDELPISNANNMELPDMDFDDMKLPDMDFDDEKSPDTDLSSLTEFESATPGRPILDGTKTESSDPKLFREKKTIKLSTSLQKMRQYIIKRQMIDGSWSGRVDTTSECLTAAQHNESSEEGYIKAGLYYLLSLQDKNGSWQNDIILTTLVMRCLNTIVRQSIDLGDLLDY